MAYHYGIIPKEDETVVSQLARLTFGTGLIYYTIQVGTMMLLVLAANSAFAGFPHLASILARDGFMPHQMAPSAIAWCFRTASSSSGSLPVCSWSSFKATPRADSLICHRGLRLVHAFAGRNGAPLVGEEGTPLAEEAHRERHRRHSPRGIATIIIAVTKFMQGAWIVFLLVAALSS